MNKSDLVALPSHSAHDRLGDLLLQFTNVELRLLIASYAPIRAERYDA
jgi:hypothetical protein